MLVLLLVLLASGVEVVTAAAIDGVHSNSRMLWFIITVPQHSREAHFHQPQLNLQRTEACKVKALFIMPCQEIEQA